MAEMLEAPLQVVQAIESWSAADGRPDPLDWAIRGLEARETLNRLVATVAGPARAATTAVALLHGRAAETIGHECQRQLAGLVVLGRHGENGHGAPGGIGSAARDLLDRSSGMVLLVPHTPGTPPLRCRRILVPMDGSSWSETALAVAVRLSRASGAAITLAQVIAPPEPVGMLPPEPEDIDLRARLVNRDDRIARAQLERLRQGLVDQGIAAHALTLRGEDARSALLALLAREPFDLVVMSACGHGGARLPDRRCGGVAAHLAGHSPAPVLIVKPVTARLPDRSDEEGRDAPRMAAMPPAGVRIMADATGHGW
jgi:nucleotide-binding universal stress UspA family protein